MLLQKQLYWKFSILGITIIACTRNRYWFMKSIYLRLLSYLFYSSAFCIEQYEDLRKCIQKMFLWKIPWNCLPTYFAKKGLYVHVCLNLVSLGCNGAVCGKNIVKSMCLVKNLSKNNFTKYFLGVKESLLFRASQYCRKNFVKSTFY